MHFLSNLHLCPIFAFFHKWPSYIVFSFHPLAGTQTNEHENDSANGKGFDFEMVVYASEFSNEEGMENDDLPPDLLRLVEQEERQILPH